MKWSFALAFLLLVSSALLPLAFAQDTTVEQKASASTYSLVRDWRVISAMAAILMVILVAIAYAFGISTDNPEIKAWASAELTQAFVTVLIIVAFSGVITLLDTVTGMIISNSNLPFTCNDVQNCAIMSATEYLDSMIDGAESQARQRMLDSVRAGKWSSYRAGAYATQLLLPIPLLQLSVSGSLGAGLIIDIDRNQVLMEHLGSLLAIMWSQRFFVSAISYDIAPIVLVLGVVARSFFVTRKLGGLLIAIGIGTLYVLPLMYVLNWITLSVTLYGDDMLTPSIGACPAACLNTPPLFYSGSSKYYDKDQAYSALGISEATASATQKQQMQDLEDGKRASMTVGSKTIQSCEYASTISGVGYCPIECRELPFSQAQTCANRFNNTKTNAAHGTIQLAETTRVACSRIPDACRMIRYVTPVDSTANSVCPKSSSQYCRVVPPLKAKCDSTKGVIISYMDETDNNKEKATTVIADCSKAQDFCRFTVANDMTKRPDGCTSKGVKYQSSDIFVDGDPDKGMISGNIAQNDSNSMACVGSKTATQSCLYVLPDENLISGDHCNDCMFAKPEYTLDPPVYTSCAAQCSAGGSGPPKINPAEFAQKTKEGMWGRPEIKTVSSLYLPAYVLPILDILVVLMFIRSFSPILGGDIEIPGLTRIL